MPLVKRVIPCLDVLEGQVVKGVRFEGLKPIGEPSRLARAYELQGADEIVLLDVSASIEGRTALLDVVYKTSQNITIPLTVGGGIRGIDDVRAVLLAGADKVSVNTAAVKDPSLIRKIAELFGSQCVVVAIDAKRVADLRWEVYIYGGRKPTGIDAIEWAKRACELGAGELLVTSIDRDGTREGYDIDLLRELSLNVSVPIIASGGAGNPFHMYQALVDGRADAVLAASIFHYGKYTVQAIKQFLASKGVPVRL
uniref:Imidazole glycerol phosphate synthase subunit HisF n=1 Tax=Fervidicoccus fontis TaxID=683846 RepID=A0A7J3ZLK8_9CREN